MKDVLTTWVGHVVASCAGARLFNDTSSSTSRTKCGARAAQIWDDLGTRVNLNSLSPSLVDCSTEKTALGNMACEALLVLGLRMSLSSINNGNRPPFWQVQGRSQQTQAARRRTHRGVRPVPLAVACKHQGAPVQRHVQCWGDEAESKIRHNNSIRPVGVLVPFHKMGCKMSLQLLQAADAVPNVEAIGFRDFPRTLRNATYIHHLAAEVRRLNGTGAYNSTSEHANVHILSGNCNPNFFFEKILALDLAMPQNAKPRVLVMVRHFADTLVRSRLHAMQRMSLLTKLTWWR